VEEFDGVLKVRDDDGQWVPVAEVWPEDGGYLWWGPLERST